MIARYKSYHYVIVGADFHSEGGAWKSIYQFYKQRESAGASCLLVNLRRSDGPKQLFLSFLFSPKIIVNGMSALLHPLVLFLLFFRKDAVLYPHDTESALDATQKNTPTTFRFLARHFGTHTVMCVSEKMAALYRERFSSPRTPVVYEVVRTDPEPEFDSGKTHIVMVGSVNSRKGFPLFSETAALASEKYPDWQFHWIGGIAETGLNPSDDPHVEWWGWRDSASPFVRQANCFFLSSIDDPQPLACLEALALGKGVVCYSAPGTPEIIKDLPGCAVFHKYTAGAALEALEVARNTPTNAQAIRGQLAKFSDVKAFSQRIERDVFSS